MDYVLGPQGFQGYQGAQGLQGRQGFYGRAFGPTGQPYAVGRAKLNVSTPTTTTINLPLLPTIYNIIVGSSTFVVPSISNVYPVSEQSGTYWTFKNNGSMFIVLTFTGGYSATYTLPVGQCLNLIVYVDANNNATYSLV